MSSNANLTIHDKKPNIFISRTVQQGLDLLLINRAVVVSHSHQRSLQMLFNTPFSACPKKSWCNTTDHLQHLQWHDLPQLGGMLMHNL